jgi:hypothetical protein
MLRPTKFFLPADFFLLAILLLLAESAAFGQSTVNGVLTRVSDSVTEKCGYRNEAGELIIPLGKYPMCYTDTFRQYAIVQASGKGLVGIDRITPPEPISSKIFKPGIILKLAAVFFLAIPVIMVWQLEKKG